MNYLRSEFGMRDYNSPTISLSMRKVKISENLPLWQRFTYIWDPRSVYYFPFCSVITCTILFLIIRSASSAHSAHFFLPRSTTERAPFEPKPAKAYADYATPLQDAVKLAREGKRILAARRAILRPYLFTWTNFKIPKSEQFALLLNSFSNPEERLSFMSY